jgi:hypothetical protein
MKITTACRRKSGYHMNEIGDAMVYRLVVNGPSALILAINFSAKRIACTWFHPETGYIKYPIDPVNPVYFID